MDDIVSSLVAMLLGMVGIFVVMGVLTLALGILHRLSPGDKKKEDGEE